ncbi:MAG: VOC family protein [Burkholderiaceae bacterium]
MADHLPFNLDHITVIAPSLSDGVAHVENQLGVAIPYGGEHPQMGTHNHLLRLGDDCFLEIIAVNPQAQKPSRPRWFGLDTGHGISSSLATWVLKTPDIQGDLLDSYQICGRAIDITRGDLKWKISVADDGTMPMSGVFPSLIQWPAGPHPAASMIDLGCALQSLEILHPEAQAISSAVKERFSDPRVSIIEADHKGLSATIVTPAGLRVLN